jgi:hypothetical protein
VIWQNQLIISQYCKRFSTQSAETGHWVRIGSTGQIDPKQLSATTIGDRELLSGSDFLYMPSAATPIEGKLAEAAGTKLVYTGGYVTGASRAITEPLLTMDEQVRVAEEVARAISVPLIADAGRGVW